MYALVLKDDLSGYCWSALTASANSEHAASILSRWKRTFTAPNYWVSDQRPHFVNEVMKALAATYNFSHRPTVAYSPWSNSTVERLMREVLNATRAIQSELKLGPQDWKRVIEMIPTALNEAPLPRLGKNNDGTTRCPLQVRTGIALRRLLVQIIPDGERPLNAKTLTNARVLQLIKINKLQSALQAMHKAVSLRATNA